MPLADRYLQALRAVVPSLSPLQRRVLEALFFAAHHAASAGQLRTLLGCKAVIEVNGALGRVGRKIREHLGAHPDGLTDGDYEWWHILATGEHTSNRGFVWSLRPEVTAALLAYGLREGGDSLPNEVSSAEVLVEGATRQITVNAYERNPVARARCIEVHGCVCAVCGFDFGSVYGPSASGFIHVHHLRPLAAINAQYEVDPVNDLIPVCPNCHAVIHMTDPPYAVNDVKAMHR